MPLTFYFFLLKTVCGCSCVLFYFRVSFSQGSSGEVEAFSGEGWSEQPMSTCQEEDAGEEFSWVGKS